MKQRRLKVLAGILGVVIVATLVLPAVIRPEQAKAFPGEAMAAAVWTYVKTRITEGLKTARKVATDLAFKNALKVYLTKLAEDTAVWLASAGTGQKPLFITDPHYFRNLGDAAAGEYLDTIGTQAFGIDVCQPVDLRTQFSVESAVRAIIDPANWCSNMCQNEQEASLTADTFLIGEEEEDAELMTAFSRTLPEAQENLVRLQQAAQDCANLAEEESTGWELYTPVRAANMCIQAVLFMNEVGCEPIDAAAGDILSLGNCIDAFTRDISTYQQIVASDLGLCQNLCSARRRVARCTASQVFTNLEQLGGQISNADFIPSFTTYFEPGENDIGQILTLVEKARQIEQEAKEEDKAQRGDSDILPLTDPVTEETETPRSLTGEAAKKLAQDPSGSAFGIYTGSPVADAIGVFTNTLTSQLLKRIFERGFNPQTDTSDIQFVAGVPVSGQSGTRAARAQFASFAQPELTAGGPYDVLSELTTCPGSSPGPFNCVMTEKFRSAIERQLTVEQALEQSFLEPNAVFGFDASGLEPKYNQGYPYRSIIIMRKNRIVPVGWELAAQYISDLGRGNFTLQQLTEAFDDCGTDGGPTSPFCGLVDPKWVLKAPENFCRRQGFGEQITSQQWVDHDGRDETLQLNQVGRQEQCVDDQTCLQENDDGSCKAFGYCVEEKPIWRFSGTACEDVNNSCESFTAASGTSLALLTDTTNGESCTVENAGCRWYCQDRDEGGEFTCTQTTGAKRYFTSAVENCPEDAVGCTEYIRTTDGTNLLANSSFETLASGSQPDDGLADSLLGWNTTGGTLQSVSGGHSGSLAVQFDASGEELQAVFDPAYSPNGQSYTFSFFGRTNDASCTTTFGIRSLSGGELYDATDTATLSSGWQRFTATLPFDPARTYDTTALTVFLGPGGCRAIYDDVQLEQDISFSAYKDYGSVNIVHLNADRVSCTADEVGCDLYRSSTETIPGIATSVDTCSEEFVGCKAFYEVPVTDNGADPTFAARTGLRCSEDQNISCATDADCGGAGSCLPSVSLVPSTGTSCSASYVGCEEYTNLDEVARGGEGLEYYSFIRSCVKPPDDQKTFYTWVGSESTGFELTAYNLQQSATLFADDTVGGGPNYQPLTDDSLCTAEIYSNPDDTRWSPDCRQFFDASLNTYYRLYARTITVSDDCHPLRNTLDSVTYSGIPDESTQCPASAAQCREYRGPTGFNIRTVLDDDFDDGDTLGWDGGTWSTESLQFGGGAMLVPGTVQTNATYAIPSELVEGKTYLLKFWAGATSSDGMTVNASFGGGPERFEGSATLRYDSGAGSPIWNSYTLGPLLLSRAPSDADHLILSGTDAFVIDNVQLLEATDSVYLVKNTSQLCAGNENCDRYQNQENETSFLKSFTRLCEEEKVGCEALIKTQNSDSPFEESFDNGSNPDGTTPKVVPADTVELVVNDPDNACQAEFQGCTELGSPTLGSDREVLAYNAVTLIDDPDTYETTLCQSDEVGCDAWTNDRTGDVSYFRDPQGRTCEYKTVTVAGEQETAWFKSGTSGQSASDRCPVVYPPVEGQPEGNPETGEGWVGLCPAAQAGCTTYLDAEGTEGRNEFLNGDIESDPVFGGSPWWVSGVTASVDASVSHSGTRSAHLTGSSGGIYQNFDIGSLQRGARYTFEAWLRINNPGDFTLTGPYAEWHDSSGTFIGGTSIGSLSTSSGVNDWTRYQFVFTVPVDPAAVNLRLWPANFSSNGEVWVDDARLMQTGVSSYLEQTLDTTTCAGVVDRDDGCQLFADASVAGLAFDADRSRDGETPALCSANPATCDANVLLKVRPDRECGKWLACQSALEVEDPTTGEKDTACFDIGLCTSLSANGQCAQFTEEEAINQTYTLPADIDKFQTLSGYSKVGGTWTSGTVEGYLPFSTMPQVGLGGQGLEDFVPHGTFDDALGTQCIASVLPSGWGPRGDASVKLGEDPVNPNEDNPVEACEDNDLDENNILLVYPVDGSGHDWTGAQATVTAPVTLGQEYVVTLNLKYLQQPQPSDKIRIEYELHDGAIVEYAVFSDFVPTTSWETYTFGPITAPRSADPVYINIIQYGGSVGTDFAIDRVSLKPVLETRTNPTLLARSCRAYPSEDAPYCTFTDENNITREGWYGYCLDQDPQNETQCLTWWPVDILAGESTVFGQIEQAQYTGRNPLFFCAETQGLYSASDFSPTGCVDNSVLEKQEGGTIQQPQRYRRPVTTVMGWGNHGDDHCRDDDNPMWSTCIRSGTAKGISGCDNGGMFDNTEFNAVIEDQFYEYEIEKIVWVGQRSSDAGEWPDPGEVIFETKKSNGWHGEFEEWGADGTNKVFVTVLFDVATGKLSKYQVTLRDDSRDDGGTWVQGIIYLREMCTAISQVADGADVTAWHTRVQDGSSYAVDGLTYGYTRDLPPFGGIAAPSSECEGVVENNPSTWDADCTADGKQPIEMLFSNEFGSPPAAPARSGGPYACFGSSGGGSGTCNATMCRGGTQTGKPCSTGGEISACYTGGGVCMGAVPTIPSPTLGAPYGVDRMKRLFAKTAGAIESWLWFPGPQEYQPSDDLYEWDVPNDPCPGGVRPAWSSDFCAIQPEPFGIHIGTYPRGQEHGDVYLGSGGTVNMYFNSRVDSEQLPLGVINIDWRDGSGIEVINWEGAAQSNPSTPHIVSHGYSRPGRYKPRIQLKDNWGWCTRATSSNCDATGGWIEYDEGGTGAIVVE